MDIWWDITDDFEMMGFISWDIVNVILEVNLRRKKNDYQQCDGFTKKMRSGSWFLGLFRSKATGNICQTWLVPTCSFRGCGFYFSFTFRYHSGGLSRLGVVWSEVSPFFIGKDCRWKSGVMFSWDMFMGLYDPMVI